MFVYNLAGRVLGLAATFFMVLYCPAVIAAGDSASSENDEVAIEYKAEDLADFHLSDYENELLECSALSAIHMWVGDNIGEDSGSEVRRALDENYWLEISREYLSLAEQASGGADLSREVGAEIKAVTAEWRRLTENKVSPDEWVGWYSLVDRCETWRPEKASRSYYTRGREMAANSIPQPKLAGGSE